MVCLCRVAVQLTQWARRGSGFQPEGRLEQKVRVKSRLLLTALHPCVGEVDGLDYGQAVANDRQAQRQVDRRGDRYTATASGPNPDRRQLLAL